MKRYALSKQKVASYAFAFAVFGIATVLAVNALTPEFVPRTSFESELGDISQAVTTTTETGASGGFVTLSTSQAFLGAEARPSLPVPGGAVNVRDFGAVGDGATDDLGAITQAIAAAPQNGAVYFPAGTYRHHGIIHVNKTGVSLWGYSGAVLHATNNEQQSVALEAVNTGVYGLDLTSTNTTTRGVANEAHRITAVGVSGTTVRHNRITNGSGAGIFTQNSHDYVVEHNIVDDTLADAIHNTGGSYNGIIRNNTIIRSGDDCVAVVSYDGDQKLTHSIEAYYNDCRLGEARGMTVVGGRNVYYHHNYIERSFGAGIYIAAEQSFATYAGHNIKIISNQIVRANDASVPSQHSAQDLNHGAILVYSDFEGTRNTSTEGPISNQNEDVIIARNAITDTVETRTAPITIRKFGKRIHVLDNAVSGQQAYAGGAINFTNVGDANYNSRGNTNNGTALPEHIGDAASLPAAY